MSSGGTGAPAWADEGPAEATCCEGEPFAISVELPQGGQPVEIEWRRWSGTGEGDGEEEALGPGMRAHVADGRAWLCAESASRAHPGTYVVRATNAAGAARKRVLLAMQPGSAGIGAGQLQAADQPPAFVRRLTDLAVKVGSRTRLLVEIASASDVEVVWYRNDRRLMEAERFRIFREGRFFCVEVSPVSVEDGGRWTCTAENCGGHSSCSAHLNVLVPKAYKRPEFLEELRALLTEQGTVSLECKVVGVPTPVLRWFKDSKEIKAGDVFALTANPDDPTSLGTYTCEAVNCMGKTYSSSEVHVVGRGSREGSLRPADNVTSTEPPPIFTKELEDQSVKVGEKLTLSCQVVIPPWPKTVTWYNKEGRIEPSERYRVLEDGLGGYMVEVPSSEWGDEGEWKCVATSNEGRVGISTCSVAMAVPKNYRKPRFMENLKAVLTEEGLVSFECKVVGFPTPLLSWFKDGQELKPGDVYQLTGTNSLGSYCCIAKNCMGQASSSAELTVEDIQNQLNDEERLQLFSKNQAPKFIQGLKSQEAKINENFRFTVKVSFIPEPSLFWYRDDQPIEDSARYKIVKESKGVCHLDIQQLEFMDQAEWKCFATNDFGHSVTSCFLKLIIPRHFKKPRFLENLRAILSEEGAVNLECKVIGVPQPILKWYKDGEELKPGDIHRIISGQDGTCCLGTYTCEAQNCMGIAASSASLLGFEDTVKASKAKKIEPEPLLQRNISLSTIHEERTSQMYDTPVGDVTLDEKGEISFSFDGKEVSVSLYETPDLTEEEALQIVEMYADQLSENVSEHNVVELPPLRFVKETSTSGNLLMEAILIDVSPEYFLSAEEDLRTEADVDDMSIIEETGLMANESFATPELIESVGKTKTSIEEQQPSLPKRPPRKKSESVKSGDDFYSLSKENILSVDVRNDDSRQTSVSEFVSIEKNEPKQMQTEETQTKKVAEKSEVILPQVNVSEEALKKLVNLSKIYNVVQSHLQAVEEEVVMQAAKMSSAAAGNKSLEVIASINKPVTELQTIIKNIHENKAEINESSFSEIFKSFIEPIKNLHDSLAIVEKCVEMGGKSQTLVQRTSVCLIETLGKPMQNALNILKDIDVVLEKHVAPTNHKEVDILVNDMITGLKLSEETIKSVHLIQQASELNGDLVPPNQSLKSKIKDKSVIVQNIWKPVLKLEKSVEAIKNNICADKTGTSVDIQMNDYIMDLITKPIQELQVELENIEQAAVQESQENLYSINTGILETVVQPMFHLRNCLDSMNKPIPVEQQAQAVSSIVDDMLSSIVEIKSGLGVISEKFDIKVMEPFEKSQKTIQQMARNLLSLQTHIDDSNMNPEILPQYNEVQNELFKILENAVQMNPVESAMILEPLVQPTKMLNESFALIEVQDPKVFQHASIEAIQKLTSNIAQISKLPEKAELKQNIQSALQAAEKLELYVKASEEAQISMIQKPQSQTAKLDVIGVPKEADLLKNIAENIMKTVSAIEENQHTESVKEISEKETVGTLKRFAKELLEFRDAVAAVQFSKDVPLDDLNSLSEFAVSNTLAKPLYQLNQCLLNQANEICLEAEESRHSKQDVSILKTLAKPLYDLHNELQVVQNELYSQICDKSAKSVPNPEFVKKLHDLEDCLLQIQQQIAIEPIEDISTLDDISAIKTTADAAQDILESAMLLNQNIVLEKELSLLQDKVEEHRANPIQKLLEGLNTLQQPQVLEMLNDLSEKDSLSQLKTMPKCMVVLQKCIEAIQQPFQLESAKTLGESELLSVEESLQELKTYVDTIQEEANKDKVDVKTKKIIQAIAQPLSEIKQNISEIEASKGSQIVSDIKPKAFKIAKASIEGDHIGLQQQIPEPYEGIGDISSATDISMLKTLAGPLEELRVAVAAANHDKTWDMYETIDDEKVKPPVGQKLSVALQELLTGIATVQKSLLTDSASSLKVDHDIKELQAAAQPLQELYKCIATVQQNLIDEPMDDQKTMTDFSYAATLAETLETVQKYFAVLEQHDIVDLSCISDLQLPVDVESEKFAKASVDQALVDQKEVLKNIIETITNIDTTDKQVSVENVELNEKLKTIKMQIVKAQEIFTEPVDEILKKKNDLKALLSQSETIIESIENRNLLSGVKNDKTKKSLDNSIETVKTNIIRMRETLKKINVYNKQLVFSKPIKTIRNFTKQIDILHFSASAEGSVSKELTLLESMIVPLREVCKKFETADLSSDPLIDAENISVLSSALKQPLATVKESAATYKKYLDQMAVEKSEDKQLALDAVDELCSVIEICTQVKPDENQNYLLLKSISAPLKTIGDFLMAQLMKKKQDTSELESSKLDLAQITEPIRNLQECLAVVQKQLLECAEEDTLASDISLAESYAEPIIELQKELSIIEEQISFTGDVASLSEHDKALIKNAEVTIHELKENISAIQENLQATDIACLKSLTSPLNDLEEQLSVLTVDDELKSFVVEEIKPVLVEDSLKDVQVMEAIKIKEDTTISATKGDAEKPKEDSLKITQEEVKVISEKDSIAEDFSQKSEKLLTLAETNLEAPLLGVQQQLTEDLEVLGEDISSMKDASFLKTLAAPLEELRVAVAAIQQEKAWDMYETIDDEKVRPPVEENLSVALQELLTGIAVVQKNLLADSAHAMEISDESDRLKAAAEPLQELYKCIATVQQSLLEEPQDEQKTMADFSYSATLAESLETVQKCFAVLEQHDIVDLSCVSDLQLPMDVESEKFAEATMNQALVDQKDVMQNMIDVVANMDVDVKQITAESKELSEKIKIIKDRIVKAQNIFTEPVEEILKKKTELTELLSGSETTIKNIENENLIATVKNEKIKKSLEKSIEIVKVSINRMNETLSKIKNYNKQLNFNKPIKTIKNFTKQIDILHFSASAERTLSQELTALESMIAPLREVCHRFELVDVSLDSNVEVENITVPKIELKKPLNIVTKSATGYKNNLSNMIVEDVKAKETTTTAVNTLCSVIENCVNSNEINILNYEFLQSIAAPLKVIGDFLIEQLMKDKKKDMSDLESSKLDIAQIVEPMQDIQECLDLAQKQLQVGDEDTISCEVSFTESYVEPIQESDVLESKTAVDKVEGEKQLEDADKNISSNEFKIIESVIINDSQTENTPKEITEEANKKMLVEDQQKTEKTEEIENKEKVVTKTTKADIQTEEIKKVEEEQSQKVELVSKKKEEIDDEKILEQKKSDKTKEKDGLTTDIDISKDNEKEKQESDLMKMNKDKQEAQINEKDQNKQIEKIELEDAKEQKKQAKEELVKKEKDDESKTIEIDTLKKDKEENQQKEISNKATAETKEEGKEKEKEIDRESKIKSDEEEQKKLETELKEKAIDIKNLQDEKLELEHIEKKAVDSKKEEVENKIYEKELVNEKSEKEIKAKKEDDALKTNEKEKLENEAADIKKKNEEAEIKKDTVDIEKTKKDEKFIQEQFQEEDDENKTLKVEEKKKKSKAETTTQIDEDKHKQEVSDKDGTKEKNKDEIDVKKQSETDAKKNIEEEKLKQEKEKVDEKNKEEEKVLMIEEEVQKKTEASENEKIKEESSEIQIEEKDAKRKFETVTIEKQEAEKLEKDAEEHKKKEEEEAKNKTETDTKNKLEDEKFNKEKLEKEAAETKKQEEEDAKKQIIVDATKKAEADAKKKAEEEKLNKEKLEKEAADKKKKEEEEEAKKKAEADAKKKAEEEKLNKEKLEKETAEKKKQEEEDAKKKAEQDKLNKDTLEKEAAEKKKQEEEDAKNQVEADAKKKAEVDAKKKAEEEKLNKEKLEKEATEKKKKEEEEEAKKKAEADAKKKAEEEKLNKEKLEKDTAEKKKKEEEEEAKKKAEADAKKKAEEEKLNKEKLEQEAAEKKKKEEEDAKKKAEADAKKKAEEEKLNKEKLEKEAAEKKKKEEEEEARKKAEADTKKKADEEKLKKEKLEKEAAEKKKQEEEDAKKKAEADAKKKAEEEKLNKEKLEKEAAEKKKKEEEEEAKKKAEADSKKKADEEKLNKEKLEKEAADKKKQEEEDAKKKAEVDAKKKAEEEKLNKEKLEKEAADKKKKEEEEEAKKKAEADSKKKADEEKLKKEKLEKEAAEKKKQEEEDAKKKAEADAKKKAEEEKLNKEKLEKEAADKKKQEEEDAKKKAEADAKKKADEEKLNKEKLEKEAAEKKKQEEEDAKKKAEADAKKKQEEEDAKKKQEEEDAKKKAEADAKKKADEEKLNKEKLEKEAAEKKKKEEEEEAKKKSEADAKKKAEEEKLKKEKVEKEAAEKKKQEEDAKKKAEADAKKKAEEEKFNKEKLEKEAAEKKKQEEEDAKKKVEADAKKKADEEKLNKEKLEKEAAEKKKQEEEDAKKKAEADAKKKQEEEVAKKKAEADAKKKQEEEDAKKKAETDAKKKAEEQKLNKEKLEKEAADKKKKEEDEDAKKKAEADAKKKAEDEKLKKEKLEKEAAEKKKQEEEDAKKKAEADAKKKAEEEKLNKEKLEKEAAEKKKKEEEEEAKKKAEADTKKKADEEKLKNDKLEKEAAEKKKQEEEDAKKKTKADAKKKAEEDKLNKEKLEKEAAEKKKKEEEEEAKKKTEADTKKKADEEKLKKEKLEKEAAEKKKQEEEDAKKKAEADAKKKAEEEKLNKEKLEKEATEKKKKEEKEAKKKADAEAKKKAEEEEAKKKADAEAMKKAEEEEAKKKADAEVKKKAEEEKLNKEKLEKEAAEKKKKEEEETKKKKDEEKAKKKAEVEAKKKADEEAQKKADADAKKKMEEKKLKKEQLEKEAAEKKKKEEEEEKIKSEEESKKKADADANKKAEEEKRNKEKLEKDAAEKKKKQEEDDKKKAETETKKKAEEEKLKQEKLDKEAAEKKKQEKLELKKKTEADLKKKAEADAKKIVDEEKLLKEKLEQEAAEKKQKEIEDAKKKSEIETKKKAEEEKIEKEKSEKKKKKDEEKKKAETDAKKKSEEEKSQQEKLERETAEKKKKDEEEAKKKLEEEAKIKKHEQEELEKQKIAKAEADRLIEEDEKRKKNEAKIKKKSEEEKIKKEAIMKEEEDKKKRKEERSKKKKDAEITAKEEAEKLEILEKETAEKKRRDMLEADKKKEAEADAKRKIENEKTHKEKMEKLEIEKKKRDEELNLISEKSKKIKSSVKEVESKEQEMIQTFSSESKAIHKTFEQIPTPEVSIDTSESSSHVETKRKISRDEPGRRLKPEPHIQRVRSEKETSVSESSRSSTLKSDGSKYTTSSRDAKKKPVFCTNLTDRTAVEGSRVKLTCSVLGSPEPRIEWFKNGVILKDQNKYRMKLGDGLCTLEVLNTLPTDSADYTCTATNENGTASSSARLKVYAGFESTPIPPTFTRSIKDTYHMAEDEMVLECRIRGQPCPTITWLKDGKTLNADGRYSVNYLADGVCRLIINHPDSSDSGKYTCKAENNMWSDQIYHDVYFSGRDQYMATSPQHFETLRYTKAQHDARRPHFSTILSDHSVPEGGTIALQVHVMGGPADVVWLRGEDPIIPNKSARVKTFVDKGLYTLALADATDAESGKYVCRAINAFGKVDMEACVNVVGPGKIRSGKPAFMVSRPDPDITVYAGEDISMACRAQGDPKPKMMWMKGLHDITNSRRSFKQKSDDYCRFTLKRAVTCDAGTYCIMAKNCYGCDRAFVTVVVKERESQESTEAPGFGVNYTDVSYLRDVPGSISSEPVVVDGGRNWVSLWWGKATVKNAAPVLSYKVEAWLSGGDGGARWAELGISPINSFDAFNLKPGGEYLFRVTPKNRYGWGESCQTSSTTVVGKSICLPEFVKPLPGQMKALIEKQVILKCKVKADPSPTIVWHKDGVEIDDNDRMTMKFSRTGECSLTINPVTEDDTGRYMCEAIHRDGRASTFVRLSVVVDPNIWEADDELKRRRDDDTYSGECAPQFTMRLRDRRVQVTYPVRLTCQVIGKPIPTISWMKNGYPIQSDDRYTFWSDDQFHTLEISQSTLFDGGYYSGTASNARGSVSCRCSLVVDKGIRAYISPDFFCGLEPQYLVREGEELRVSACVEAYPSVGIAWHRDGVKLRPSRRAVMTLDHDGGVELALANVTTRDAGIYTCTATNEVGKCCTSTKVVVEEIDDLGYKDDRQMPTLVGPEVPYSKEPMFVKKPRSSDAMEGDTVIILCEVTGDPKPEVIWLRDFLKPEYYRDARQFRRVGEGPEYRLLIPHAKLDHTGAYSVIARNCHGEAKAVISLQIYTKGPDNMDRSIRTGKVEVLPSISQELKDLRCCDGDAVTLECRVKGTPTPTVKWEKDGVPVPNSGDFNFEMDGETARLVISTVYPEDEGMYTCIASNALGKAYTSSCLVVDVPEEKENLLSQQLVRPPVLLSAGSTPRSTPCRSPSPSPVTRQRESISQTRAFRSSRWKLCPPKFYAVPFNRVAEEGETVVFRCSIAGHPVPWVVWDKDGVEVTPSSRITIKEHDEDRILQITDVTVEDAGLYKVTVDNEVGRVEATARLEVIKLRGSSSCGYLASDSLAFRRKLVNSKARPGEDLVLKSEVRNYTSSAQTKWYKNGHALNMNKRISELKKNGHLGLSIKYVRPEDEGTYTLVVSNSLGDVSSWADVTVVRNIDHGPPEVVEDLKDISTFDGETVSLITKIKIHNDFHFTWTKNGEVLPDCDYFQYVDYGKGLLGLRFEDIFVQDSGEYSCIVSNNYGTCKSTCNVCVKDIIGNVRKNDFSFLPQSVTVEEGKKAVFEARIQPELANNNSKVVWELNGKLIKPDDSRFMMKNKDKTHMLSLNNIHRDDSGIVRCALQTNKDPNSNMMYESLWCTINLTVVPSEFLVLSTHCNRIQSGPNFLSIVGEVRAVVGQCSTIKVLYKCDAELKVRWIAADRDITPSNKYSIDTNSKESQLTIKNINKNDNGIYKVQIEDCYGSDSQQFFLFVDGAPDPVPGKPAVEKLLNNANVTWLPLLTNDGCPILGYHVEMCSLNKKGKWETVGRRIQTNSYIVKGLNIQKQYIFRIRAENAFGLSEPGVSSDPFSIEIKETIDKKPQIFNDKDGCLFSDKFKTYDVVGRGKFGIVKLIVNNSTSEKMAAKFVKTTKPSDKEKVFAELEIMHCLTHPKLIKFIEAYVKPSEMIIVTEYISGGELFERVSEEDFTLTERDCALFLSQICEGVQFMHDNNIVHLDLKPENIMCQTRPSQEIKIIDFGLAKRLNPNEEIRVFCGTPEFLAPEVVNFDPISKGTDMWSIGVICYVLLSGLSPFSGDTVNDTYSNILQVSYDFDDEAFDNITNDAKEFIENLLIRSMDVRRTASECLQSKWIQQHKDKRYSAALSTDKLKKFVYQSKWQRTGNAIRAVGRMVSMSTSTRLNANRLSNGLKKDVKLTPISETNLTNNKNEESVN